MMTTATILCPGPSLPSSVRVGHLAFVSEVIAVNRAIFFSGNFAQFAQWWAVTDDTTMQDIANDPAFVAPRGIITRESAYHAIGKSHDKLRRCGWLLYDTLDGINHYKNKTALAAAWVACEHWKMARVIVHGCDLEGGADWDQKHGPVNRTPQRWHDEGRIWREAVERWPGLSIVGDPQNKPGVVTLE